MKNSYGLRVCLNGSCMLYFICDAGTFTTISIYQYRKLTTKLSRDDTLKITEVTGIKGKGLINAHVCH